jgi:histidine triad (HIT) family protein
MSDCAFCKIIADQAPAKIIYRDECVLAFHDRSPRAPVHVLVVPLEHIASLNDLTPEQERLMGHMLLVAQRVALQENTASSGYRVIINTGRAAGQTVHHLHAHVLGGGPMRHPMG